MCKGNFEFANIRNILIQNKNIKKSLIMENLI